MPWLNPDDSWRAHTKPQARQAIEDARGRRWLLHPHEHDYGTLRCPGDHPGEPCEVKVRNTSGDRTGGTSAAYIRQALRKCDRLKHQQRPQIDVVETLEKAMRLVRLADRLRTADALEVTSRRRLESAAEAADSLLADQIFQSALEADARYQRLIADGQREAERFGLVDRFPPDRGVAELRDAAESLLALLDDVQLNDAADLGRQDLRGQLRDLTADEGNL